MLNTRTNRRNRALRNTQGSALTEATATFAFFFPICILVFFAGAAFTTAFVWFEVLSQAAMDGSRDMAIQYGQNPTIATDRASQDAYVYDQIRHSIVTDSSQFDDAVFTTVTVNGKPKTAVTVTVKYTIPASSYRDLLTGFGLSPVLQASSTQRAE